MAYVNVNECGIGSFVFYESFFKDLDKVPESEAKDFLWHIVNFGLYGIEPELTGFAKIAWEQMKISITNANSRYISSVVNGQNGGAPEGNDNATKGKTCRKCARRKSCATRLTEKVNAELCPDFKESKHFPKQPNSTQNDLYSYSYSYPYLDSSLLSKTKENDEFPEDEDSEEVKEREEDYYSLSASMPDDSQIPF